MPINRTPYSKGVLKIFFLILLTFSEFNSSYAQNAIVTENLLAGNPYSEWGVTSSADFRNANINGYATDISVNMGSTVHFKIDGQNGVSYSIKIYRLGYYNGNGARLQADLGSFTGVKQPAGAGDAVTGLLDCSNWAESASWLVPGTAVSGVYIAKIESAAGRNHIVFIVRNDGNTSKLFYQTSDATWQAYNGYGGNYFYTGTTAFPNGHAVKISYNRPFFPYNAGFAIDNRQSDWYMNSDYPMIRWLERNGYDMSYTTSVDVARSGSQILNHKIFLSVGHDEYVSKEQRDNMEAARNAGVHMAFFSGNEVYWKTRWEADANGNAFRNLVCYKEGTLANGTSGSGAEGTCGSKCDVSAPTIWTGLWRMGAAYDAPLPENALTGQISWDELPGTIVVPYAYKNLRFWRNTSVASLTVGQTATMAPHTLGFEYDYEQYPNTYPDGRMTMSSTPINGHTHKLSLYRYGGSSGPLVFGAGTVQWSWGLDDQHFGGTGNLVSNDMQQATINLFADMGVQPGSKQSDLVAATASTDVTAPVSAITSPATGSTAAINTTTTISGTATDANTVAGVEVSVDGGVTWQIANTATITGTTTWTFDWVPTSAGTYTIKSRGYDDTGNMEATGSSGANIITITVTGTSTNTIFTTQVPPAGISNDGTNIELGVKFRSTAAGYITGVRFYKNTGNTGTHTGELYSSTGTRLAQGVFSGETVSGWQTVTFSSPVAILANTTYIAAYYSGSGNFTNSWNYFGTAVMNSPLSALADGTDGPNGVYIYTSTPAFPNISPAGAKPNYWVDAVYSTGSSTPVANAGSNQTITLPTSSVTLDGSASTGTITSYSWTKISGPGTQVITTPTTVTTTVTGLAQGTYIFQLSLNSGVSTSQVTITVNAASTTTTIFTTQVPPAGISNDGTNIELGVKFRSTAAGYITGVRFYKNTGNTGTHTGELYSSTGTRLAQGVFSGETVSGWQTVTFSSPVAILANTTYIAAYYSGSGNFTNSWNYFGTAVMNSPLSALADGTDGPNGVYIYTSTPAFPNISPAGAKPNYWVDAVYSTGSSTPVANAGSNQTITLPTSSVTLDGSASTGTITSYSWTKISGPGTQVITTPTTVTTTVTGLAQGTYIFQLSLNSGVSTSQVTITVNAASTTTTIFTTQVPPAGISNDGTNIELGVKFRSTAAGYITGVRFYKNTGNTGTHTGELYSSTGTRLAQGVFSGETVSGWQTVTFSSPVAILANTTYIAAYYSGSGNFTNSWNYFGTAVMNSPLSALADGTDGPNGVYIYTSTPAFPNISPAGAKPNYWVDAVYSTGSSTPVANAGSNQTITLPTSSVTLDGSASTGTITSYSWTKISGPGTQVITTPTTVTTTVTGLAQGTYIFQLSLNSGVSTSQVTITVNAASTTTTIFTTQVPPAGISNDGTNIELGVKFRSTAAGYITGVRFYKNTGNTGTHTGELYSSTGTRLAQGVFSGETVSGWQTVTFSSPVAILANTTYIAAYYSGSGNFTNSWNYFGTAVMNSPLSALADGTDGPNGVYIYTSTPAFPNISPAGAKPNYWVDAVYSTTNTGLGGGNPAHGFNAATPEEPTTDKLSYFLGQNYPNPVYQQNTKIKYSIPVSSYVELVLFDIQGRQIKKLVNEIKKAGIYDYELNTSILGKGIYYYRMQSGDYLEVKKMVIQ